MNFIISVFAKTKKHNLKKNNSIPHANSFTSEDNIKRIFIVRLPLIHLTKIPLLYRQIGYS